MNFGPTRIETIERDERGDQDPGHAASSAASASATTSSPTERGTP